jgi:hypothetical protein
MVGVVRRDLIKFENSNRKYLRSHIKSITSFYYKSKIEDGVI